MEVGVFHARPRLGHPLGHGVSPTCIVGRLLVGRGRLWCAVDLDEHKLRRILMLPDHIKPGDPRFLEARSGILQGRLLKVGLVPRLHVDEYMDDMHDKAPQSWGRRREYRASPRAKRRGIEAMPLQEPVERSPGEPGLAGRGRHIAQVAGEQVREILPLEAGHMLSPLAEEADRACLSPCHAASRCHDLVVQVVEASGWRTG